MIGIGKIGLAMTKNIMKAGYKMKIYDLSSEHVDRNEWGLI